MRKCYRWLWLVALLFALAGTVVAPAAVRAQTYRFRVPELQMQVYVQPAGSARLVYDITFDNLGSPIDVVDIGLPHDNYDIDTMTASVDGAPLTDIRRSTFIDVGVEVHLNGHAIDPGSQGTLHFEATMPDMVYQDTTNRDYASMRITPTWFDEGSVTGTSTIQVAVHLPEGVQPDEALSQLQDFTSRALFEGHTVVVWEFLNADATEPHMIGVSFPRRVMTQVIEMTLLDLAREWITGNPAVGITLGVICVALFAFLFFRFSGGTGITVFFILTIGLIILFVVSPLLLLPAIPLLLILVIVNESSLRKRTKDYLPPIAQTEGGGIKRGLTAPEASVLLELPLHKILTLIIFGLLEKNVVTLIEQDPLTVSVREPFRVWDDPGKRQSSKLRRIARHNAAQAEGTVLHAYEEDFLDQLERHPNTPVAKIDFTDAMSFLVQQTAAKMKAFDLSDTKAYYERVVSRAMEQTQTMGEVEEREAYLDQYLPWVMMNDNYPTVLTPRGGYHYWPVWARPARRAVGSLGGGVTSQGGSRARSGGQTSLGDVAGSFAGWAENTMGGMAAAVLPSAMKLPGASGGFVDLGGVDRVTGDVFEALSKASASGKGGRSGGSSCACACAGCACACACAGGGR